MNTPSRYGNFTAGSTGMLPKTLKYGNKTESAMARSYTSNIQPNGALNGYTPGSVTTINIPTGPNLALICAESVLKFDVTTLGADQGRLDSCGAHGFIQRIRVFHGSNLLEDTDTYGMLAKEYFDLQVSTDACFGKYSILAGTRSDVYLNMAGETLNNLAVTLADTSTLTGLKTALLAGRGVCVNSGALLNYSNAVPNLATTTYSLTLISMLGSLCSNNYFPLFECTSAPLRLEIQWVNTVQMAGCFPNTTTGFRVDAIEYIASYLALSGEAMNIIRSGVNGPFSFTMQGVRNYQGTALLANGVNTQVNFNIAAKFGSVKSIITSIRDTASSTNTSLYFPYSSCRFGLQNYSFRIGSSSSIPAIPPSSIPQYFQELIKSVGSISDLNHQPSIDLASYSQNITVGLPAVGGCLNTTQSILAGSVNSGSFYVGLDLENYAESDKTSIYTGYNTKTEDIILCLNFLAPAAIASARLDAFVMFDQEVVFENGTCYVSF